MLPALRRRLALFAMALTFVSTAAPMPAQSDDAATGCLSKVQARGEPPVGGSAVVQICSAGRPVKDVSGVDLTNPAGVENPNGHLALGTILPVHTTIGSPAATVIDLESPTGVIARIYGGAQLKLLAQSDRSESYGDASGRTGYDVPPHRLDFMNVVTQALFAIVKGTDFDVNVGAGNTDVSVQRGLVATGRKLSVRVADQSSGVDCIKIVELVAAGESRTYAQTPDVKDFADRDAAHAYFADQIRAATANGDPTLIDAANSNATAFDTGVCPLDALAPAAAAAAVSHAAVAYGILGALALGGAALSVRNNTATPGPTPKPTASPTAVPTSTPSPAPTQTPSPTAAPTATPVPTPSPSPSPSPTPSPSATPAPTPTPSYGAVTLTPASQTLSPGIGMPATATFVATQPGYTGPFTATQPTCAESVGGTPVSSVSGSTISVTLQAQAAAISATCTVVVTGGGGMTATASVSFVVTAAGAAARRPNRPLATPAPRMGSARA